MKKITDERLIQKNLRNIKIVFAIQYLGIIGILFYQFINEGINKMNQNPLWLLFLISNVVLAFLSMDISIEQSPSTKPPTKVLIISTLILTTISIIIGLLVFITPGFTWKHGIGASLILFACGLVPILYGYYLKKKLMED